MRKKVRDKLGCHTFAHRLPSEMKADLHDPIQDKRISIEEQCLDWSEQEERVDAPNSQVDDLWSMPLNLERGELRLRECRRYMCEYRHLLKQVEAWSESSEIRLLLRDVLPAYWRNQMEDEEKRRAKKRMALCIMLPEDHHPGIMEYFRRNLGEPDRTWLEDISYCSTTSNGDAERRCETR